MGYITARGGQRSRPGGLAQPGLRARPLGRRQSRGPSGAAGRAASRLGRLTAEQVITSAINLAEYDLTPATLTVTLTLSNSQKIRLRTGHRTPVNNNRYLQTERDSQAVYIVYGFAVDELYKLIEAPPLRPTPLPILTATP